MATRHDDEPEIGSDSWWSRDRKVTKDDFKDDRSRNDRVADLWADQGWEDDEVAFDDTDLTKQHKRYRGYRYGRRKAQVSWAGVGDATLNKAVTAHGMVQSFVDSFTTRTHGFRVVFATGVGTAATTMETKTVLMDPAPIFDKSLSGRECGLILTGEAVHEVSHTLYDVDTRAAVNRRWTGADKALAFKVSNVLSEARIEARFAANYPGYSDVFAPMLEYISRAMHGHLIEWDSAIPTNFIVSAIRFAQWGDFTGWEAERDWWIDLGKRACVNDTPKLHVKCVQEALDRIASLTSQFPAPVTPPEPPQGGGCDLPGQGGDEAGDDTGDEKGKHRFVPPTNTAPVTSQVTPQATLPSSMERPNQYAAAHCYQCGKQVLSGEGFISRRDGNIGWRTRHGTCPR